MICKKPYINAAGQAFGCGQCMPCRINRRRIWQSRIMLEAHQYKDNCFATLTYSDDTQKTLDPEHLSSWLKRLREHYHRKIDRKFRFFGVGEYGDLTERPHYHVALFNFPTCYSGQSRYSKLRTECCSICEMVRNTWGRGNIFLGTLEPDSAGYVAGYTTKRMTQTNDPRLHGRYPEFARMSLRPGIGGGATNEIARVFLAHGNHLPDVPSVYRTLGSKRPFGRYLQKRTRKAAGRDEKAPQSVHDAISEAMLPLRLRARADEENPSLSYHIQEEYKGKSSKVEFYSNLNKRRNL